MYMVRILLLYLLIFCMLIVVKPTNDVTSGGGRFNISSQVTLTYTVIGVPLPAIVWQLNGNNINLPSDCMLNSYNVTLGSGFDCSINQTLNLRDDTVASIVSDPQDIIILGMYELDQLVVESNLIQKHLRCKKRCGQVKWNHIWK